MLVQLKLSDVVMKLLQIITIMVFSGKKQQQKHTVFVLALIDTYVTSAYVRSKPCDCYNS